MRKARGKDWLFGRVKSAIFTGLVFKTLDFVDSCLCKSFLEVPGLMGDVDMSFAKNVSFVEMIGV